MNIFQKVKVPRFKSTKFDLQHSRVQTMRIGKLTPMLCVDVCPGDVVDCSSEVFMRFMPLIAPIMHKAHVYVHYWYVPNRLVWSSWNDYITGGEDGNFSGVQPFYATSGISNYATVCAESTLWDYLGVSPLKTTPNPTYALNIDATPFRAYQLIYNHFYRDENLVAKLNIPVANGGNVTSEFNSGIMSVLRTRAWEKDYATSSLPFAQKGTEESIPLVGTAPVVYNNPNANPAIVRVASTDAAVGSGNVVTGPEGQVLAGGSTPSTPSNIDPNGSLFANLSQSTSVTINTIRNILQYQRYKEINARTGSRVNEFYLGHFGVSPSDARLDLPEYLGGGVANVLISEVLQQSQTDTTPLGTMGGHAVSFGKTNRFHKFIEEFGWIIGIISVLPEPVYSQQVPRRFVRTSKYDYLFPEFACLGEQEVRNHEIYYVGSNSDRPMETFGYQGRYNEYRFMSSSVHGAMHSSMLDWTMARSFESRPNLNQDFIECKDASLNEIFNVTDPTADNLITQIDTDLKVKRSLPFFSDPASFKMI